ncbi:ABC transporter substrate-binding protein [Desulfobacterales bacterium HSG16]|nr:ABC transporter substrate-binding protein [Desulfobacterales bacterium HSG16]
MKMRHLIISILSVIMTFCSLFSSAAAAKNPIHIAIVCPLTGDYLTAGESMIRGVKFYIDKINKGGGISGRKIILDIYDDKSKAVDAVKCARKIVQDNRAVAVIGHYFSSCSIAAGKIYKEHGIPAVTPCSTNVDVTIDNKWYFRTHFNDKFQGRFLAYYSNKILERNAVSIIYEDKPYGSGLADEFEKTSKDLGVTIKARLKLKIEDSPEKNETSILQIANKLSKLDDAGMIFLATHANEGAKLLKQIRDAHIKNAIITPDSFNSETFIQKISEYDKEKGYMGYYSNGILVTSPLVYDIASDQVQLFKQEYMEKHAKSSPDWRAVTACNAAMVIKYAIEKKIQENRGSIEDDRRKIRDCLAGIDNITKSIAGLDGPIYFDHNGDQAKTITIGEFKKLNIISSLIQLQIINNLKEVPKLSDTIWKERILLIDEQYMYKTNIAYAGVELNEITDFDFNKSTCSLDLNLWFRFYGKSHQEGNLDNFIFMNAEKITTLEKLDERFDNLNTYILFHLKGIFKTDFLPSRVGFGEHVVGISLRHKELSRNNLIFVVDDIGMGLTRDASLTSILNKKRVARNIKEWTMKQAVLFQDTIEETSLGNPDYLSVPGGKIQFSRFNLKVLVKKNKLGIRRIFPQKVAMYLLIICTGLILVLSFTGNMNFFTPFVSFIWLVKATMAGIILLAAEVIMIDWLQNEAGKFALALNQKIFDILYWVVPAFLIIQAVKHFIWTPLEIKTGNKIPNIMRFFVSGFIIVLTCFGITAFVFGHKVTGLLATSGVVAMIIGLAIQINISNIFSGIALNLERPFRIGDRVRIGDNQEGTIIDVNWRATRIQTGDNCVCSIPNSTVSETIIHNFDYPDEVFSLSINVFVDPALRPFRVQKILEDAVLSSHGVLKTPAPTVRFIEVGEWAARYSLSSSYKNYGEKAAYTEFLWESIWKHMNIAGIEFARHDRNFINLEKRRIKKHTDAPDILLNKLEIFKSFTEDSIMYLAQKIKLNHYPKGSIVVQEGDWGDSMFIIAEGIISVRTKLETGSDFDERFEVARVSAGDVIGEMSLLTGEARTASLLCLTETVLYEISKEDISPIMQQYPEMAEHLAVMLTERKIKTQATKGKYYFEKSEKEKNDIRLSYIAKLKNLFLKKQS